MKIHFRPYQRITGHSGAVYSISPGDRFNTVFSAAGDRFVALWDLEKGVQLPLAVQLEQPVYAVIYISEFHWLVAGNALGGFHLIDLQSKQEIRHITLHTHGIYDFYYRADRHELLVLGGDGVLSVWSLPSMTLLRKIHVSSAKLRQIAVSLHHKTMAIACGDGMIGLLDTDYYAAIGSMDAHKQGAYAVAWHPTKPVLLSGGRDAMLRSWNEADNYHMLMEIPAHHYSIYSIAFDASNRYMATSSRDKTIKIWDAQTLDVLQRIEVKDGGHTHSINKLWWWGDALVSCGDDRKIVVWKND